jgi:ribosomal protein S15P/S13E
MITNIPIWRSSMTVDTQSINQAGADQLEKLVAEFELWRGQKKSRTEQIPETLLQEAQKLTQHCKASLVRKRLGLTTGKMKKMAEIKNTAGQSSESTEFMALAPHNTPSISKEIKIEVCTPQGLRITLSGTAEQDPLAIIAKIY